MGLSWNKKTRKIISLLMDWVFDVVDALTRSLNGTRFHGTTFGTSNLIVIQRSLFTSWNITWPKDTLFISHDLWIILVLLLINHASTHFWKRNFSNFIYRGKSYWLYHLRGSHLGPKNLQMMAPQSRSYYKMLTILYFSWNESFKILFCKTQTTFSEPNF